VHGGAVTYEYRLAPYYWIVRMLNMVVSKEMILNFVARALTGTTPRLLVSSYLWPRYDRVGDDAACFVECPGHGRRACCNGLCGIAGAGQCLRGGVSGLKPTERDVIQSWEMTAATTLIPSITPTSNAFSALGATIVPSLMMAGWRRRPRLRSPTRRRRRSP
jgi:hypothetical protein